MKRLLRSLILLSLLLWPGSTAGAREPTAVDCGTDLDCFIEAAQVCQPALVTWQTSFSVFGMLWLPTAALEITTPAGDQCLVRVRIESVEVRFTDELVLLSLDQGSTLEEIQYAEQEANTQAALYQGLEATCPFLVEDLTALLQRWRDLGFSPSDWSLLQCDAPPAE